MLPSPISTALLRVAFPPPTLASVLAACVGELERVGIPSHLARHRTERTYVRLTPAAIGCEAWLIRWPPGAIALLHDHGSACGIAQVLYGALEERRCTPGRPELAEHHWRPGAAIELPFGTCHEVQNREYRPAFSVHVYDPKLEHMTFYERRDGGQLQAIGEEQRGQW